MDTAIVVFTRDLRLHDNPALHQAGRYLPELVGLERAWIQTPWKLPPAQRVRMGYPSPLVELAWKSLRSDAGASRRPFGLECGA